MLFASDTKKANNMNVIRYSGEKNEYIYDGIGVVGNIFMDYYV